MIIKILILLVVIFIFFINFKILDNFSTTSTFIPTTSTNKIIHEDILTLEKILATQASNLDNLIDNRKEFQQDIAKIASNVYHLPTTSSIPTTTTTSG